MSNASNLGCVQQEIHAFAIEVAFAFVRRNSDDMAASCVVSSSSLLSLICIESCVSFVS